MLVRRGGQTVSRMAVSARRKVVGGEGIKWVLLAMCCGKVSIEE